MGANSRRSARKGRHNTTLTLQDALQILQQSLVEFQNAGGELELGDYKGTLCILLPGVYYCLQCCNLSLGDNCQYCGAGNDSGAQTPSGGQGSDDGTQTLEEAQG